MNYYPIYDSHIHLDKYPQDKIPYLIEQWQNKGVGGIIAVSMDLKSSYQLLEWQNKYPHFVHVAIGYHPEQTIPTVKELNEITALIEIEKNKIVAIGEVGIIHYRLEELEVRNLSPYEELLYHFAKLANNLDKPIILHAVHDKAKIALEIVKSQHVEKAHFHWFKSDIHTIRRVESEGYFISLTPELTFRKRDQDIAKAFNMKQILLETDGPWPLEGNYRDKMPEPIWIRDSIETLAKLKNKTVDQMVKQINDNTKRLYGVTE